MYINPFENKLHAEHPETVLGEQLKGWVYESHAWVVITEHDPHHKRCRWCGAESTVDMVCSDKDKVLCTDNPVIHTLLLKAREAFKKEVERLTNTN